MTTLPSRQKQEGKVRHAGRTFPAKTGAGNESRTRDLNLGKVALYQLSYSRALRSTEANYKSTAHRRVRQRLAQVVKHRHGCQHRRDVDEHGAEPLAIEPHQRVVE